MSQSRPLTEEQLDKMMFTPDLLGQMIRTRRLAIGWSQSECAKRLGVTQRTIARWEDGEGEATSYKLFNFVMHGESNVVGDHWIRRALRAEGIINALGQQISNYRSDLRNGNEAR